MSLRPVVELFCQPSSKKMSAALCLHSFITGLFKNYSYSAFVKTLRFVLRHRDGSWSPYLENTPPRIQDGGLFISMKLLTKYIRPKSFYPFLKIHQRWNRRQTEPVETCPKILKNTSWSAAVALAEAALRIRNFPANPLNSPAHSGAIETPRRPS